MAEVRPFPGWRYDPGRSGSLAETTCPPYDVISPDQQAGFHRKSPYNVIRLEFGEVRPTDDDSSNRYTRARDYLQEWESGGVIRRDETPALYVYDQEFTTNGDARRRRALLVALKVGPWSPDTVMPHEETMSGPKADRLQLLSTVQTNISPLFGLYDDSAGEVRALLDKAASGTPDADFVDEAGERHRLWQLTDGAAIAQISDWFQSKAILLADGHHRYETALKYSELPGSPGGSSHVLVGLVAEQDPGLLVMPTHRTFTGLTPAEIEALEQEALKSFSVRILGDVGGVDAGTIEAALHESGMPSFVAAGLPSGKVSVLTPAGNWIEKLPADKSGAWKQLDLVALHLLLIEPALRLDVAKEGEGRIRFTHELSGTLSDLEAGNIQLAMFLNTPAPTIIRRVAEAGDKMPQKSTYFYPKMRTGMVIRTLDK